MQHALAAGGAFFRPHAPFLQNADERGVESGINRFAVETFRQGLHARAAAERQHGVGVLDRLGGLFEEDVVALAFDGEFLDLEGAVLQFGRHAEGGGDDADFALAAGEADGHAGAAAEQEHLPVLLHDGQQFGYVFSLGDYHKSWCRVKERGLQVFTIFNVLQLFRISAFRFPISVFRFSLSAFRFLQWVWPQFADGFHHVGDGVRQGPRHGGGNVDHAEAFLFQADLGQHVAGVIDPAFGAEVAFHEMAAAFEAAGHQHAVRAVLERLHEVFGLQPARAGGADDADVGRILDAHGPRQIRRRIGAVVAAKGHDLGFKYLGFHG